MITDKSRAFWIGASDTSYVVGNMNTASFKKWWLEKLGLRSNNLETKAMKVGTHFEHKILDMLSCRKDHQIIIPELHLRVNYDGDKDGTIYEVKTTNKDNFKVSKAYWRQAQVEMYAMKTDKLYIVSYLLNERDYKNYFAEIDRDRMQFHKIEYDKTFIDTEYLPRLKFLGECLEKGVMPYAIKK